MTEGVPLARALAGLELIQNQPGVTAQHLGERLGVSERAARRYVAVLREAGIPIESRRGRYGGYWLGRGIRLPPLTFTAAEALALVMAVLDGHHDTSDPTTPVGAAMGKVLRSLPEAVAAEAELVRRNTAPAPDRGAARPNPDTTALLVEACAARRRVRLHYRSEGGNEWSTDVDPWAVVVRHARWYLVCYDGDASARRAYRVDRVQHAQLLGETFIGPDHLDAVGVLEAHLAEGWEHGVEVIVDAPATDAARWIRPNLGQIRALPDGRSLLTGTTSNPTWYAEQLAVIKTTYRVVRPREVQVAAVEIGERLLAAGRK